MSLKRLAFLLLCLLVYGCTATTEQTRPVKATNVTPSASQKQRMYEISPGKTTNTALVNLLSTVMTPTDLQSLGKILTSTADQQAGEWQSQDTLNHYAVTINRTFNNPRNGNDCRETVIKFGENTTNTAVSATFCSQNDRWIAQ